MDAFVQSLKTLRFEASLDENEQLRATNLRKRVHASTTAICALGTVFCATLSEIRQWIHERNHGGHDHKGITVGVIGCGRVGQQIIKCLLNYGRCSPSDILVSTRRPDTLKRLSDLGVDVGFNNARVARSVHLLFIACLPSQLPDVSKSIAGCINFSTLVFSVVGGMPVTKISQLLNFKNIVKPELELLPLDGLSDYPSDTSIDVIDFLRDPDLCSLVYSKSGSSMLIQRDSDWQVGLLLSCLNICTLCQLTAQESFKCLNAVIFPSLSTPLHISINDLRMPRTPGDEKRQLPFWTLLTATAKQPKLKAKLRTAEVCEGFSKKFLSMFKWSKML
ncbi:NADP-dependent oxidoreductase domain-containing protein 1-like [Oscarella lobularis]|uniref:NADP-dependent oxidoreductase domain-containing protein 1-like n=1 Tax=Oscarella lobularis TaxID=121494 RepID=UPI0033135FF0